VGVSFKNYFAIIKKVKNKKTKLSFLLFCFLVFLIIVSKLIAKIRFLR